MLKNNLIIIREEELERISLEEMQQDRGFITVCAGCGALLEGPAIFHDFHRCGSPGFVFIVNVGMHSAEVNKVPIKKGITKMEIKITIEEVCSNHPNEPRLGYLAACEDAIQRLKRREEQWCCGKCGRWVWSEFFVAYEGLVYREKWWNQKLEKERVNGTK